MKKTQKNKFKINESNIDECLRKCLIYDKLVEKNQAKLPLIITNSLEFGAPKNSLLSEIMKP